MIIDERSYEVHPAHVQDYLDLYEAEGMTIQISHLGDLVGWFTTDIGTVNEVVHLWRYKDMGDREKRRARMNADPAWQAFRKKASPYLLRMRNRILVPTAFSPLR